MASRPSRAAQLRAAPEITSARPGPAGRSQRGLARVLEGFTVTLVGVLALAVAFDYVNGFHDTANAIATSVATRALRPRTAIVMAASFNFIGAFAGTAVAKTIGSGLVDIYKELEETIDAAEDTGEIVERIVAKSS